MDKLLLTLTATIALGACSNGGSVDTEPLDTASSSPAIAEASASPAAKAVVPLENPVLLRLPDSNEGDSAAIEGLLTVRDGCVGILAGGEFYIVAPTNPDIRWTGGSLSLTDGNTASPGAKLLLGGSQATSAGALEFKSDAPAACTSKKVWVTVSAIAK